MTIDLEKMSLFVKLINARARVRAAKDILRAYEREVASIRENLGLEEEPPDADERGDENDEPDVFADTDDDLPPAWGAA